MTGGICPLKPFERCFCTEPVQKLLKPYMQIPEHGENHASFSLLGYPHLPLLQHYNMASQFAAQTQLITDKFNALELRTLEDQNARLREQIAAQSQEAQTALILAAINGSKLAVNGTVNTTAGTWTGNGSLST